MAYFENLLWLHSDVLLLSRDPFKHLSVVVDPVILSEPVKTCFLKFKNIYRYEVKRNVYTKVRLVLKIFFIFESKMSRHTKFKAVYIVIYIPVQFLFCI